MNSPPANQWESEHLVVTPEGNIIGFHTRTPRTPKAETDPDWEERKAANKAKAKAEAAERKRKRNVTDSGTQKMGDYSDSDDSSDSV